MELTRVDKIMLFIVIYRTTMIVIFTFFNFLSLFSAELELLNITGENNSNKINNNKTNDVNNHWPSIIKNTLIYLLAAYYIHFKIPQASDLKKLAVIIGAILVDLISQFIKNVINNPDYLRDYLILMMWIHKSEGNISELNIIINNPKENLDEMEDKFSLKNTTSFLPLDKWAVSNIQSEILSFGPMGAVKILLAVIKLFKPQQVNYYVEDLMLQHHFISIALFILALSIFFFFILILYNVLLILYKDKIMSFFKNKYILMYLNLQLKLLKLETIILIILIFYCFYYLFYGLHFLSVFPVDTNIHK